jgi:predicted O-methyltransferase YrrM
MDSRVMTFIQNGLADPQTGLRFLLLGRRAASRFELENLLKPMGVNGGELLSYYKKLASHVEFTKHINSLLNSHKGLGQTRGGPELYVLTRALRPRTMMETGVAAGISSAYILQAMADNESGKLVSLDIPNYEVEYLPKIGRRPVELLPQSFSTGFAIPTQLRSRWELHVGKSQDLLPSILESLRTVDIFFHDSEHTYANMLFEFRLAWKHLNSNGLLLADDISWNKAFFQFAQEARGHAKRIRTAALGAIIKGNATGP